MKGLFLPGYACTGKIWDQLAQPINAFNGIIIDWPKEKLDALTTINSFANWIIGQCSSKPDYIVGHSMGGLVALQAAEKMAVEKLILVESYLLTPPPFFRNVLMETAPDHIKTNIFGMLNQEKGLYSEELRVQLQNLNMLPLVEKLKSNIALVYGDRGIGNNTEVIHNLGLSDQIQAKVTIEIVEDSCHFPMVENPQAMEKILCELLP